VNWIAGAPWIRYKAEDAEGEMPEGIPEEERKQAEQENREGLSLLKQGREPLEISISRKRMQKNMDIPEGVEDVLVGPEDWGDNRTMTSVGIVLGN